MKEIINFKKVIELLGERSYFVYSLIDSNVREGYTYSVNTYIHCRTKQVLLTKAFRIPNLFITESLLKFACDYFQYIIEAHFYTSNPRAAMVTVTEPTSDKDISFKILSSKSITYESKVILLGIGQSLIRIVDIYTDEGITYYLVIEI